MFKSLFKGNKKKLDIKAPLEGNVVPLQQVPDPAFSEKMLGDGVAILPTGGNVVSPVEGEVLNVFPTKHAVGLRTEQGVEILIHIGLDTVLMNGEGFHAYVQEGDKVKVGQPLIDFSLHLVEEKAKSSITPIVITNGEVVEKLEFHYDNHAYPGKTVIMHLLQK